MFDKDNKFGFINNNESNNNIEGLDNIKTDIKNIKDDVGNEELTTTAKDLKGAINELDTQYKDIANEKVDKTYLNVEDFGAKGDGVTDDTDAIISAIQTGKKVYFPKGTYLISSTIVLADNSILFGDGYVSVLKCSPSFNGTELIKILNAKNTEIKDISLNGGSSFDYTTRKFTNLNSKITGILISNGATHVSVCRINNVEITLFSKCGINVEPSTYEVIVNNVVIKACNLSGIYNRGTDSHWSNIYIGLCGYNSSEYLKEGAHLEGANNNYSNFKIYLCDYGGLYLENGTSSNNYSNFNIQECKGYGLNINTASNNNLTNIVIDSCENAINMYKTSGIYVSGLVSNSLTTITTKTWLVAYSCEGKNYIDVLALVGKKSSDDTNITYTKSNN